MKKVWIFLLLTFTITFALDFYVMANGGMTTNFGMVLISAQMLIPAICSILTRLITKEGFSNMYLKPKFKGNIKWYLVAWFGPAILIILGALVFFVIFPKNFDSSMTQMGQTLNEQYTQLGVETENIPDTKTLFKSQIWIAIFLGPILNIITCMGEELGWRGYLLPHLKEKFSIRKATLITGIIWGLWHAPVIAMGHNYGLGYAGFPYLGIIAMVVFCIFYGAFLSYLTLKVKSAIPAGMAHGGLNSTAAISTFFIAGSTSPFIGPLPMGGIGGIGIIIVGILCYYKLGKFEENVGGTTNEI